MRYSLKHRKTSNTQPATSWLLGPPAQRLYGLGLCVVALSLGCCYQNANAGEEGKPLPFEFPKRTPFVIPEPRSAVPAASPSAAPEATEPEARSKKAPKTKSKKPRKDSASDAAETSALKAPDAGALKAPDAGSSSSVANSSPAPGETAPSEAASTSASATPASAEPVSGSTGKRYMLQGKTEVVDFRLSEDEDYKKGMAALDKRNYAAAAELFKAGAAKMDEGHQNFRAECNFFEAKALMMQGKLDQAMSLLKSAIALFDKHDPSNPYKLAAQKQVGDLLSGKARMDIARMHAQTNLHQARVVDQDITFYSRVATDDSDPILLRCDKEATKSTIHDCFAEMTCLETAELGTNVSNAPERWQPLLVKGEPAAFEFGAKSPVVNIKVNGQTKEVPVNLPMVNGLRRVLLATDNEKVCAIDVDNNDTWLLQMENLPDGTIGRVRWALLKHVKQKSATWGVSRGLLNKPRPTGNAWGSAPHNGFGKETGYNPKLYGNSQGKY